jgi:hypothetical protein
VNEDSILIEPGIYFKSNRNIACTVIDGQSKFDSVVSFLNGEGPGSVLKGVTVVTGTGKSMFI